MNKSGTSRRNFLASAGASLVGAAAPVRSGYGQTASEASSKRTDAGVGKTRPNIVMFMPDELRADALACYGNPVVRTPNFDKLAQQGTRFTECQTAFPICGAARCSMLTGWPVSVRGHRSQMYFLRPEEPNLFRYLRSAGYDVFWFGKNDALAAQCFDDSVTAWNYVDGRAISDAGGGEGGGGGRKGALSGIGISTGDRRDTSDYRHLAAGIRILERKETERPFCIFLPLLSPHPPYSSPEDFSTMYSAANLPDLIPPGLPNRPAYMERLRASNGLAKEPSLTFRKMRASYLGKVSYADWLLGELMEALERTGHASDTALLSFSDHGDYAGDYGLGEKWAGALEECLTHVPMLARVPGGVSGHTVTNHIELFDVMKTCLDLAGTEAKHTHFSRSLLPQIRGGVGDAARAGFSECGYNAYEPQCFQPTSARAEHASPALPAAPAGKGRLDLQDASLISRAASIKTHEYKFVRRPQGQSELYVLDSDPRQLRNRFGERSVATLQDAAQQRLLDWYINTTGIAPWDRDQRAFPPYAPQPNPVGATADTVLDAG
ncbi:MAG: sulfatase-like hydrolase/transferase [Bryocella sp.]